jgi:DNA-binding GntR family transcriptional regulator
VSRDDLADITHMRLLLDVEALRLSIQHGNDDWEAGIVAAFHRLARYESRLDGGPVVLDDEWGQVHRGFHIALLAACPSERQLAACSSLFDQSERYRRFSARFRTVPKNKKREHNKLMDAALERDADRACELLTAHINGTLKNVEIALEHHDELTD